jgi:hypothetical protein
VLRPGPPHSSCARVVSLVSPKTCRHSRVPSPCFDFFSDLASAPPPFSLCFFVQRLHHPCRLSWRNREPPFSLCVFIPFAPPVFRVVPPEARRGSRVLAPPESAPPPAPLGLLSTRSGPSLIFPFELAGRVFVPESVGVRFPENLLPSVPLGVPRRRPGFVVLGLRLPYPASGRLAP